MIYDVEKRNKLSYSEDNLQTFSINSFEKKYFFSINVIKIFLQRRKQKTIKIFIDICYVTTFC